MKTRFGASIIQAAFLAGALALSACGNGNSGGHGGSPVIIIHNGHYGYYDNTLWCDFTNNYCGTGLAWGISNNGCYYNGSYCNGGNGGGNNGGGGNTGGGGSGNCTVNNSCGGGSIGGRTKDVDLQKAKLQFADLENRAQTVANQFQMNVESARQLTQLADKMSALTAQGQMTDADRTALADSALGIVGISAHEINGAIAKMVKDGDKSVADDLVSKAAANLGMPSTEALRDQILPSLGINMK